MKLDVTLQGLQDLRAGLKDFSDRRFNAAMATALTRTAAVTRKAVQEEASRSLDRPTPYTLRQLRFTPASAKNLSATVGFNIEAIQDISGRPVRYEQALGGPTKAQTYLPPNITGGTRGAKRFEKALRQAGALPAGYITVPGAGAQIDAYGNMAAGQIKQILSQLQAASIVAGSDQNTTARSRTAAQKRAGGQFFAVMPGARVKLAPGVYQRELLGRNITPVLIYVRAARYKARYDFYGVAQRTVDAMLAGEIYRAVQESAARLAARGR